VQAVDLGAGLPAFLRQHAAGQAEPIAAHQPLPAHDGLSRRIVPINLSAKLFCHGDPAEIGLSPMPWWAACIIGTPESKFSVHTPVPRSSG
jgi:hypothetical protein